MSKERSKEERIAINKHIAKEVFKIMEKKKLAIYNIEPRLKEGFVQAFNPNRRVELKNFFVATPTAETVKAPESARDIMYFINDYAKAILSKYHYIADKELATTSILQGANQPTAIFKESKDTCEMPTETFRVSVEQKALTPYTVEGFMKECWKRFIKTGQHYFITHDDLSKSPEFNYFFQTLVADRVFADMLRLFWFAGYTSPFWAAPTADMVGTTVSYFTVGNGLWGQVEGDTTIPYVSIPENSGVDYDAQRMTPDNAYALIGDCLEKVSMRAGNYDIHVTPYVFRSLTRKMQITTDFSSGALSMEKFDEVMRWGENGVRIINRKDWGFVIQTFMNDGTKYHNPNRVLIYERENIACAYHENILMDSAFGPINFNPETKMISQYIDLIFDATYLPSAALDMVKAY